MIFKNISAIAIDWGSSKFRAYLLDNDDQVLATIEADEGVKKHYTGNYSIILEQLLQPWQQEIIAQQLPIFMAGMVGSNLGWHETPYLPCPLNLEELAAQLYAFVSPWQTPIYIVPGVKVDQQMAVDVMRGEETLLLGAHQLLPSTAYCLPGTHNKWAVLKKNQLYSFTTTLTGELYAVLKDYSLLGFDLPKQQDNQQWFIQGVKEISRDSDIIMHLFKVRAKRLLKQLPDTAAMSYLSGLLIGSEINTMQKRMPMHQHAISIVATTETVAARYQTAFQLLDIPTQLVDGEQAFIRGMATLIRNKQYAN